jgi:hypothetical protein
MLYVSRFLIVLSIGSSSIEVSRCSCQCEAPRAKVCRLWHEEEYTNAKDAKQDGTNAESLRSVSMWIGDRYATGSSLDLPIRNPRIQ